MVLLRHASAGERGSASSFDRERQLDRRGRADARALPRTLAGFAVERIVTSPHARCIDTVRPVAAATRVTLELRCELEPDAAVEDTRRLLEGLPGTALVCTHREVIERLFEGAVECEKGGAWVLGWRDGSWAPAAYLPPPSSLERTRGTTASVPGRAG